MSTKPPRPRPAIEGTEQRRATIQDSLMFLCSTVALRFGLSDDELAAHLAELVEWYDGDYGIERFELTGSVEDNGPKRRRSTR